MVMLAAIPRADRPHHASHAFTHAMCCAVCVCMCTCLVCTAMFAAAFATTLLATAYGAVGPTLTLNNGVVMPQMALGVWQYSNATAEGAIDLAFKAGFRQIDTAQMYGNQVRVSARVHSRCCGRRIGCRSPAAPCTPRAHAHVQVC